MKKSVKKAEKEFNIRKTLPYRLLIISTILLVILLIVWVGIKINKNNETKRLGGELGSSGIFGESQGNVGLEVVNFKVSEDNLSINVSIQRDGAAGTIKKILIIFNRSNEENCNYSITDEADIPLKSETKEYIIDSSDTDCGNSNFTNVFDVSLDWEVVIINLTQTNSIGDININGSRTSAFVLDLDNYFEDVGNDSSLNIKYNLPFGAPVIAFAYSPSSHDISFDTSNTLGGNFIMNLTLGHSAWNNGENVTSNSFNVAVYGCLNHTWGAQNLSVNRTNSCASNTSAVAYYCSYQNIINRSNACATNYSCSGGACVLNTPISNHLPTFNDTACDDLEWEMNTNYILNMKKCWYDVDGDTLIGFRYANSTHNRNLTIHQNSTNLTLIPNNDWISGSEINYFYIYVNDSRNQSEGRVDFDVLDSSSDEGDTGQNNGENPPAGGDQAGSTLGASSLDPKILLSSPSDSEVHIFNNTNKTFTISASGYTAIRWYLNGAAIAAAEGKLTYNFTGLKEGDAVKVEVINGTKIDSKTWAIKIETDETGKTPRFDMGDVLFYSIIAVIVIIIGLVIWLFFVERGKNKDIGAMSRFGITRMKLESPEEEERESFNIPN